MTATSPSDSARACWIAAAIAGLLVWLATSAVGTMRWYEGLVLGGVTVWILGAMLIWIACAGPVAIEADSWLPDPAPPMPIADAAQPVAAMEPTDDLKQIKGIGPKLEELLHEQGVTRFAQIAAWDEAEIDRFAEIVGRMGSRIRSDDWVGQARQLVAGLTGAA